MIRSLFFGVIGPEKIKISTQNFLNTDNRVFDIGLLIMHYMMHLVKIFIGSPGGKDIKVRIWS